MDEKDKIAEGEVAPKMLLKRSELLIMRRMANRYPIVEEERREMVDISMDIARNAKSKRLKLSALGVMTAMDRINLEEMKVYIAAKKEASSEMQPAEGSTVNVNINNVQISSVQSVLEEYSDVITRGRIPSKTTAIDNHQQQVHPEQSGKAQNNGKAS